MQNVSLGAKYKDLVTGFEGVAVGHLRYLNGCEQVCIKAGVGTDGKMPEPEWIDVGQVELIGEGVSHLGRASRLGGGGPQPDAPPTSYRP
jgi:hypothetical protein